MVELSRITSELAGLVGWANNPIDPNVPTVNDGNAESTSGLYYEQAASCITLNNVFQTCPVYIAADDGMFNDFLTSLSTGAALRVSQWLLSRVRSDMPTDLIDDVILFPQPSSYSLASVLPASGFVGYKFVIPKGFVCVVNDILAEFTDTGVLEIHHINAQTREVTAIEATTPDKSIQTEADVQYKNPVNLWLSEGTHYIGYFLDGLILTPINRQGDGTEQQRINAAEVSRMYVSGHTTFTAFEPEDVQYTGETYGLNFRVTTYRDYTDQLIQSKDAFAKAIQLQVAVDVLNMFLSNNRSNRDERLLKQAQIALEGIAQFEMIPSKAGIVAQLAAELQSMYNRVLAPPKIRTV